MDPGGRARRIWGGLGGLALVPLFFGGLYFAAKTGIQIADRQVPPGSVAVPGEVAIGSRWQIAAAGMAISASAPALREYDFQRSGSGELDIESVTVLGEASLGWQLLILPGGDRRYLTAKFVSGERQGDEIWVIAKDLKALCKEAAGGA